MPHHVGVLRVQLGKLGDVCVCVGAIRLRVRGIRFAQRFQNGTGDRLGVAQGEPDMLVVLGFVMRVSTLVRFLLHALDGFLLLRVDAGQHGKSLYVRILGCFQQVVHPCVRFAAHINEQVAAGDFDDVVRRGVIVVQVDAVVKKQGQFYVVRAVAEKLARPVVLGKGGADDAQGRCGFTGRGQKRARQYERHQKREKLFHESSPHSVVQGMTKQGFCRPKTAKPSHGRQKMPAAKIQLIRKLDSKRDGRNSGYIVQPRGMNGEKRARRETQGVPDQLHGRHAAQNLRPAGKERADAAIFDRAFVLRVDDRQHAAGQQNGGKQKAEKPRQNSNASTHDSRLPSVILIECIIWRLAWLSRGKNTN